MREPGIKFKCPDCGHNRIVQIRHHVQARDVVDGFIVADSSSPGRKFNLQVESSFNSDGKVVRFECECCGFTPKTKPNSGFFRNADIKPVLSTKHLYDWLKRHKMLDE